MADNGVLAVHIVKTIYDLWGVDPDRAQWVGDSSATTLLREGYGFDWWPGDFKVGVRIHGPHPELPIPVYRVWVQTDLLCDIDVSTTKFAAFISDIHGSTPTFAVIAHPTSLAEGLEQHGSLSDLGLELKSAPVWFCSVAYIHEGTKGWLPSYFARVAILQAVEAQFRADRLVAMLGGKADRSSPPASATASADRMLDVDEALIVSDGRQPSKWIGTGEFEQIVADWGRWDSGFGKAFEAGLGIETPFGHTSAILVLKADEPHPRLGNGLVAFLKIPCVSELQTAQALAIELNYLESSVWSKSGMQFIGNWGVDEWGVKGEPGYAPVFSCFIPNQLYQRGLAETLVVDGLARAKWARELLRPDAVDLTMEEILNSRLRTPAAQVPKRSQREHNGHRRNLSENEDLALSRSPPDQLNAADRAKGTSPWRTILVGSLVAGVLLLMAFFLSNNPSNPFRTRVGAELKPQTLSLSYDEASSHTPVTKRDTAS